MIIEVKTPELSDSITEGTLLEWHKQPGDAVVRDETLIDLETDKVILEIAAPASGVLVALFRDNNTVVTAGEVIAHIDNGEPEPAQAVVPAVAGPVKPVAVPDKPAVAGPSAVSAHEPVDMSAASAESRSETRTIIANGEYGAGVADASGTHRQPMSRLRLRIAERLVSAQHSAAILTTFNEVNMQAVKDVRAREQAEFMRAHHVKLGFMAFFVKAAVAALQKIPVINAMIDGPDIVFNDRCDIGVAISTSHGLVVPIVRAAERLDFPGIERAIADYAQRAEAMDLRLEEISGGTFTISNGGVFGSLLSTPIINPPQSAILGMHAIQDRPVAENGAVVIRPMMYLALSYDHRLIDGRDAVGFLAEIKGYLENRERVSSAIES
ncbi:MAG TPA: dihydrolipoyllysine-residue succinyltransferase [Burkholderiales bacterium]|nr:dihydrolipoyllysine-residue succinyltransferase [Burkholderiales bacterium]